MAQPKLLTLLCLPALLAGSALPLLGQGYGGKDAKGTQLNVKNLHPSSAIAATAVADAAMKGDDAAVRRLLKEGASVNAAQGDGMTALAWAADNGNAPLTKELLAAHANVHAVTRIGAYTPLQIAARKGNPDVVNMLIKAGADVKALTTTGASALHFAASSGNPETVEALLDHGADPNLRDTEQGQTPLVFAAEHNRAAAIRVLLKHGANPSIHTNVIKTVDAQAVEKAITKRRNEVLISYEPEKHKNDVEKAKEDSIKAAKDPNSFFFRKTGPKPVGPFTPDQIQAAIDSGRAYVADGAYLKDLKADSIESAKAAAKIPAQYRPQKMLGTGGLSPLHHAVRQGSMDAVIALLNGGANVNDTSGVDHMTPLLTAAINGQFDVAMELIKHHADPNIASNEDMTPLYAVLNTQWMPRVRYPQPQAIQVQKTSYIDVMKALLEAGADPNVRLKTQPWYFLGLSSCGNSNCGAENIEGSDAFWRAAYGLDVNAMQLLVKYGAKTDIPTEKMSKTTEVARGGRGGAPGGRGAAATDSAGKKAPTPPARRAFTEAPGMENLPGIDSIAKATPAGKGVYPIDAATGVGYGSGYAGGSHRHAPDGWMPAVRYLVEVLHADVNQRDENGYTPLHNAAARGDNEMILYLVAHGADVKAVSKKGQTVADMANGPQSRVTPYPDTVALLEKLGSVNQHHCVSC